jgi:hypothetical protein
MPSILDKMCEKLMNFYIFLANIIGYKIVVPNIQASSFVVDENDELEIIEITAKDGKEVDKENLTRYLKHHIMLSDDKFKKDHFDEPLIVRFKYQNEIYRICLKHLIAKNTDHSISVNDPKYLSAIVKQHDNDDDDGIHVTDVLVEYHGPDRNFFSHIPDVISDILILLKEHHNGAGNKLHTFDMMGNIKIHEL